MSLGYDFGSPLVMNCGTFIGQCCISGIMHPLFLLLLRKHKGTVYQKVNTYSDIVFVGCLYLDKVLTCTDRSPLSAQFNASGLILFAPFDLGESPGPHRIDAGSCRREYKAWTASFHTSSKIQTLSVYPHYHLAVRSHSLKYS